MTRREWLSRSLRFASSAAIASTFSACSRNSRRNGTGRPSSVTVLYPYDETVLGPEMDMPAKFLMFLPLAEWTQNGIIEGRLAESWKHSDDYRTWTVRLRQGIKWHDGIPVTTQDIKFCVDLWTHPDVLALAPGSLALEVIDDLTYKIVRNGDGFWGTPLDDWTVYYPKHKLDHLDPIHYWDWPFWTEPVGDGPYRQQRTIPNTLLQLRANPDFYRGAPRIPNVILKFGDSTGTGAVPELLSGNVDAATTVRPADVLRFADDHRFAAFEQPFDDLATVLLWNHRDPLFSDSKVRRALTLAINRRELFEALNLPSRTPVFDAPPTRRQFRLRQIPAEIPFDPRQANRLLDEAGWHERDHLGVRVRNGKRFSFSAITGRELAQDSAAIYVQAQLKRVGISMEVVILESSTQFQRAVTGDYEAAFCKVFMGWGPGNGTTRFLESAGYNNARFTELIHHLQMHPSPDEEDCAAHKISQLFQRDVPAMFLYPDVLTTVASSRIRGLDRSPYPGDLTRCMDELWLEEQA